MGRGTNGTARGLRGAMAFGTVAFALLWGLCAGGAAGGCTDTTGGEGGGGAGGTGGATSSCPNDLPDDCPNPEPSYSKDVQPILEDRCYMCHSAGGQADEVPFTDYAHVYSMRTGVLTRVYGCKMPPSTAPQLNEKQRATLLAWLVCGAKNN